MRLCQILKIIARKLDFTRAFLKPVSVRRDGLFVLLKTVDFLMEAV